MKEEERGEKEEEREHGKLQVRGLGLEQLMGVVKSTGEDGG